jgi:alkylation response protein AidB-like acyl-CoA dehydrogenase
MNLNYTAEELAFRDEVRAFLDEKLPADIAAKVKGFRRLSKQDHQRWQKILSEKGWYATHWPEVYGGVNWGPVQKHIWDEESARYGAPRSVPFGVNMVAPVIIKFGTEEQKQRYLPRILSGEDWWCQGYSEPGAGSDLASLRTKAVRQGDHYIVNGTKTWNTMGQYADMIFCLVRTSDDDIRQMGISFLLIDMHSPGIEVQPIVTIDCPPEGHQEINMVHFTDVKVPVENLIGEEGKGWTYAKYLLEFERGNAYSHGLKAGLQRIRNIADAEQDGAGTLSSDSDFQRKLSETEIAISAMEFTELRILSSLSAGKNVGPESSLLKCRGTELQQALTELALEATGSYAVPFDNPGPIKGANDEPIGPDYANTAAPDYFNTRKVSIYAGSNEVQRNIMAKMVLGL